MIQPRKERTFPSELEMKIKIEKNKKKITENIIGKRPDTTKKGKLIGKIFIFNNERILGNSQNITKTISGSNADSVSFRNL